MVDFPGEVCTTLFYGSCNFRCPWCHNADLVLRPWSLPEILPEEAITLLLKRRQWIQAVCISGGEPTLSQGLVDFVVKLKERGFKVKLDTNGSRPRVLKNMLESDLLDYVSMDVKAPPEKYSLLSGVEVDLNEIKKSIELIIHYGIDYEFRTTLVPGLLSPDDIFSIGRWLAGARRYVLQQFRTADTLIDPGFGRMESCKKHSLGDMAKVLQMYFKHETVVINKERVEFTAF